ncbi:hypothetical protein FRB95_004544 [Tulasnella sp. JGI-2019a]|nr:hypothetical protein FRB95_004544 [Tulasnella sp. JGI-2019a]
MARTKQTARKSLGGVGRRVPPDWVRPQPSNQDSRTNRPSAPVAISRQIKPNNTPSTATQVFLFDAKQLDNMEQPAEAQAFLNRLSALSKDPGTPLTSAIAPALEDEAALRRLFATERDHKRLQNPYVGLVDVFGANTECIHHIRAREVKDKDDLHAKYLMALDETTRRKDGEIAMAQTFEDFKARWAIFSEGALSQLVDWTGVIAAGGSVLACLAPLPDRVVEQGSKRAIRKYYHSEAYPASDIDLFLYDMTPEQAEEKCKAIFAAVRDSVPWEVTSVRTKNAVSIHCQYPYRSIQIVLRLYQSPAEVLAGFDVDSSCVAFNGNRVLATPRAIMALTTQTNQVAMDRRSPSYEVRLAKYAQRGFEIHVPELRRADVDPTIFERALSRVPGLARLLVLEKLSTQVARDKFLGVRGTMRGRPAITSTRSYRERRRDRRRDHRLKGDLKAEAEFGGLQMNDYDIAFHIPYGPGIDVTKIEKMVYQTDLGMNSTFNPKNKGRTLHRHPASFGTMEEAIEDCCGHCPTPETEEEKETFATESEQFITGRIAFIQVDPGRQSITGSFHPIDEGEWSEQAYIRPVTRLFTSIAAHDRAAVADFTKKNADSINWRDHVGRTALQFAILCSAHDICKDLIQAGSRMTARVVDGRTSLHLACQLPDMEDVVTAMLAKSGQTRKEVEEQEKAKTPAEGEKVSRNIEEGEKVQDSSEDDWTDQEEHEENQDYAEAKKKVGPVTESQPMDDDVLEDTTQPDILDVNAPDWDQSLTPLGYAILSGSLPMVKILVEAGADCKTPQKAKGHGVTTFHPLTLTALAKDESIASQIAAHLVDAGGATSAAADEDAITVFHRLVSYNRVETVTTLLRIDSGAKTASRFLATSWAKAVSPVTTPFANGSRAMVAVLIAYGGCRVHTDRETFDRSVAANPAVHSYLKHDNAFVQNTLQPLEASLRSHNDLYRLVIALEPDSVKNFVPHETYGYRRSEERRRSLLDFLRGNAEELRTLLVETPVVDEPKMEIDNRPKYGSILDIPKMEDSNKTGWEAEAIQLERQYAAVGKKRRHADEVNAKNKAKEAATKKAKRAKMLSYYQNVISRLELIGAKPWNEIFPDEPSKWTDGTRNKTSNPTTVSSPPGAPTRRYMVFDTSGVVPAGAHLELLYDELFAAIWTGNTQKVQEMCLPPSEEGKGARKDLLQITAGVAFRNLSSTNNNAPSRELYTTLFVALRARKWATARAILAIAKAQQSEPEEEKGTKLWDRKARIILESGDDEADSDAESDDSAVTPTRLGFDTIAAKYSTISVNVDPASLLSHTVYLPLNDVQRSVTPMMMAVYSDDVEMFKEICELMLCLDEPQLPSTSIVDIILQHDSPSILDEYIRRTGEGLTLPKEETLDDAKGTNLDDEEDSKFYMGLNVHGKKRKDLAKQGDPNAPAIENESVPLLWRAATNHGLSIIDYLSSGQPLEAYKHYLSTATKPSKRLAAISNLDVQLPALLGFDINHLGESAILATVASTDTSRDPLKTLKKLMTCSPKLVSTAINAQVKLQRVTPLLAACGTGKQPKLIDWLLANGADPCARDERGWNIFHLLSAHHHKALFMHLISNLPSDITATLMVQQSRGRQNTPLSIAVKTKRIDIVSSLLQNAKTAILPALVLRDVTGSIPLHTAILAGHAEIVTLLASTGPPEALHMENGVGSTPLEVAASCALSQTLRTQRLNRHTTTPDNPCHSIKGFSAWHYGEPDLDPEPGYTVEDETEIKGFRKVLDAVVAGGVLSRKPQLLEALTAFAEESEKEWEESKSKESKVTTPTKRDTPDAVKTLEVLSKAVVAAHQRTLVHLKDVQDIVFCAVNDSEENQRVIDDGGLMYETDNRAEFFLSGIWKPKDSF